MYKLLIRPVLFLFDPEKIHYFTFKTIRILHKIPGVSGILKALYNKQDKRLETEVFGLKFKNKIGLAAGFDKNAVLYEELSSFGFGFIEIGTVTPIPQEGNPKPRLFRLPQDKGVINRMGFNNDGLEAIIERLRNRNSDLIIGGNIGKNKNTPNEKAIDDYSKCFEGLFPYVDYFVVNVSSPNTPNLRALQEKGPLLEILNELQSRNLSKKQTKPILLKIAPDLNEDQLKDIVEIINESKIAGIIATNTTISRDGLNTDSNRIEDIGAGGLSGAPVKDRSTEVIRFLHKESQGKIPIIGVGGINTPADAIEKLEAGASLIQVFSGFIYEGPSMIKKINKKLLEKHSD